MEDGHLLYPGVGRFLREVTEGEAEGIPELRSPTCGCRAGSATGQVTPSHLLARSPAGSSCLKMSTFLSVSSKHPSTLMSARRCAPEPCGTGRSAPLATWTFSSTSWW